MEDNDDIRQMLQTNDDDNLDDLKELARHGNNWIKYGLHPIAQDIRWHSFPIGVNSTAGNVVAIIFVTLVVLGLTFAICVKIIDILYYWFTGKCFLLIW